MTARDLDANDCARSQTAPTAEQRLVRGGDGVYLNHLSLRVQTAADVHFLSSKLFRRLLITQTVSNFTVVQDVDGAVRVVAGNRALGVIRSHAHA